jgi:hypothetical protein
MMRLRILLGAMLVGFAAMRVDPAAAQAPGERSAVSPLDCDRNCLIGFARGYMASLKAHRPGDAPVAKTVMFTENNVPLALGDGLWGTISDVSADAMEVADAETGNAAWFGYVKEHGEPAIYAMRIKVVDKKITEVETVVHRKTGLPAPFGDVTKMEHDPAFQEVLPEEQRRPRARLMAVAQSYFNTVEYNDGTVFAPFDEECARLENGISTTAAPKGAPTGAPAPGSGGPPPATGGSGGNASAIAQGCEAQFKLGLYRINKRVRERLFPIIDVERGIVVASGFFDHANYFDSYKLTNGATMRTAMKWPNSISLLEAFRIRDGKIHRIEAVFTYVPYFMHNPWAGAK